MVIALFQQCVTFSNTDNNQVQILKIEIYVSEINLLLLEQLNFFWIITEILQFCCPLCCEDICFGNQL